MPKSLKTRKMNLLIPLNFTPYYNKFQNGWHTQSAHRKALTILIYDKGFEKWYYAN
jgi:hypothetical protein